MRARRDEQAAARHPKVHIKPGDQVYIRAGKDREGRLSEEEVARLDPEAQKREANRRPGRRARVIRVLRERGRVVVEGVNMQIKHQRPRGRASRAAQIQSGRIEQPGAIPVSNVMLVCPSCDRPTRVRRGEFEGKPVRVCRRCGEPVDRIR
jgi:large subunit ribosomal protein L24